MINSKGCLALLMFCAVLSWSQEQAPTNTPAVEPENTQEVTTDTVRMATPPPVSNADYPTQTLSQERSDYLLLGLTFQAAYTDNLLEGIGTKPVSDIGYSVWPSIALQETTSRMQTLLSYSPGFTEYQYTSSRNEVDQNVSASFQYRLSPHVTLSLRDTLHKTSDVFSAPDVVSVLPVSGSALPPTLAVIAPVADQLSNTAGAELTYQFGRDSMVGASGNFNNLYFANSGQISGLYNSTTQGGSGFYSHRLARRHYVGATYQYQNVQASPLGSETGVLGFDTTTQTQAMLGFYTVYLKPTLSFSLSGGPQHYDISGAGLPSSQAWKPAATASLGWQAHHTNFAASYARIISGGGGLFGAYQSNSANGSIRQVLTPSWNVGVDAFYSIYKEVDPNLASLYPGGHTVGGSASLQRRFGTRWNAQAGYTRLHQTYANIAAVSTFPNVNREWISISYQFAKPIGR